MDGGAGFRAAYEAVGVVVGTTQERVDFRPAEGAGLLFSGAMFVVPEAFEIGESCRDGRMALGVGQG